MKPRVRFRPDMDMIEFTGRRWTNQTRQDQLQKTTQLFLAFANSGTCCWLQTWDVKWGGLCSCALFNFAIGMSNSRTRQLITVHVLRTPYSTPFCAVSRKHAQTHQSLASPHVLMSICLVASKAPPARPSCIHVQQECRLWSIHPSIHHPPSSSHHPAIIQPAPISISIRHVD